MVVLYPLKSRFMQTGFVKSCVLYSVAGMLILSLCMCIPVWNSAEEIMNDLCSSYPVLLFIFVSQVSAGFTVFIEFNDLEQHKTTKE